MVNVECTFAIAYPGLSGPHPYLRSFSFSATTIFDATGNNVCLYDNTYIRVYYICNKPVCTCMYNVNVGKLVPLVYLISFKFAPYANIFLKFIVNTQF